MFAFGNEGICSVKFKRITFGVRPFLLAFQLELRHSHYGTYQKDSCDGCMSM